MEVSQFIIHQENSTTIVTSYNSESVTRVAPDTNDQKFRVILTTHPRDQFASVCIYI